VFEPGKTTPALSLLDELQLSEDEFIAKYRLSPLKRARRGGYLRNIAVTLGNSHDQRAVAPLEKVMMLEPEPVVRAHAAWALGQIGGKIARQALMNAGKIETELVVKAEIYNALEHSGHG
jgi:epoxyqueuosine reductase